ncbi:MAG: glycosyltransferase family 4 protein [Elainellaceae cyanobacterium]
MNSNSRKPKICLALPGINYVPDTTYVLNTIPIVNALKDEFDITLVFRSILKADVPPEHSYLTILLSNSTESTSSESVYFSPTNPFKAFSYLNQLEKFAHDHARQFDLIIERQWILVGSLASAFSRRGVPAISIHEAEFYTAKRVSLRSWKHWRTELNTTIMATILPHLRQRWINQTHSLIVETEQMKQFLLKHQRIKPDVNIYAIPNGVDPTIFYPRDRPACRQQLGIAPDAFVLVYVGSLNRFIQEPAPLIQALGQIHHPNIVLHILGDGMKRRELKRFARHYSSPTIFHGKVSQDQAALYIGAANLCVAPYNKSLFPEHQFTSASLKVCEYLACGRLVMTIPCDRMNHLLDHGCYGFLVENQTESYIQLLQHLPDLGTLTEMETTLIQNLNTGKLANQHIVLSWDHISEFYKQAIRETFSRFK